MLLGIRHKKSPSRPVNPRGRVPDDTYNLKVLQPDGTGDHGMAGAGGWV